MSASKPRLRRGSESCFLGGAGAAAPGGGHGGRMPQAAGGGRREPRDSLGRLPLRRVRETAREAGLGEGAGAGAARQQPPEDLMSCCYQTGLPRRGNLRDAQTHWLMGRTPIPRHHSRPRPCHRPGPPPPQRQIPLEGHRHAQGHRQPGHLRPRHHHGQHQGSRQAARRGQGHDCKGAGAESGRASSERGG
jgi:hypothetical protein